MLSSKGIIMFIKGRPRILEYDLRFHRGSASWRILVDSRRRPVDWVWALLWKVFKPDRRRCLLLAASKSTNLVPKWVFIWIDTLVETSWKMGEIRIDSWVVQHNPRATDCTFKSPGIFCIFRWPRRGFVRTWRNWLLMPRSRIAFCKSHQWWPS
jgi:hypothetical protein